MNLLPRFRDKLTNVMVNLVKWLFPFGSVVNVRMNFGKKQQKVKVLFELFHKFRAFRLILAFIQLRDLF